VIGALILVSATYYGLVRIAEAKCDAAVGSSALSLDPRNPEDLAAFERLQAQLVRMGQDVLADRLEQLRLKQDLWVAPGMGPERWAAYVESLGLARRIYIRRMALLNPLAHLYPSGADDVPTDFQAAFAWLSLGGAMRHELAHYDGAIEESEAYRHELAWYDEVGHSAFFTGLSSDERAAWTWALESAVSSAEKAAERDGGRLQKAAPEY
jgi:hypothetical protein